MDVSAWYVSLGIAVVVIAIIQRFIVYKILVGNRQWLPEKAAGMSNLCSGLTLLAGMAALVINAVLSRR